MHSGERRKAPWGTRMKRCSAFSAFSRFSGSRSRTGRQQVGRGLCDLPESYPPHPLDPVIPAGNDLLSRAARRSFREDAAL
jgi:hypothetical protein